MPVVYIMATGMLEATGPNITEINFVTVGATVVNVLILLAVVRIFLFKPIQKVIAERQAEADAKLDEINEEKEKALALKEEYEKSMKEMNGKQNEVLEEARKKAGLEYDKIVLEANETAKDIIDKAKREALQEKDKIIAGANNEITEMVVNATAKVLAVKKDPAHDKALYDQFIQKAVDKNNL